MVSRRVTSSPDVVEIYRGGNFVGVTPLTITGKAGTVETVTAKKSGFNQKQFEVEYGKSADLKVELSPKESGQPKKNKGNVYNKIDEMKNPFK